MPIYLIDIAYLSVAVTDNKFDTPVAKTVPVSTNCTVINVVNRLLFFRALTEKQ